VERGFIPTKTPDRFRQANYCTKNQSCKKRGDHRYLLRGLKRSQWRVSITLTLALLAAAIVSLSISNHWIAAALAYFFMGLFFIISRIVVDTQVQGEVPVELQGRVRSTIWMGTAMVSLMMYLGIGYVGNVASPRLIYLGLAAIVLLGACVAVRGRHLQASSSQVTSVGSVSQLLSS